MSFLMNLDDSILNFFSVILKNVVFDKVMPVITNVNNHGEIWILIAVILMISKNEKAKRTGFTMIIALAVGYLAGELILKNLIARPRPIFNSVVGYKFLIGIPGSYSFPSGHTTSSFAALGVIWFYNSKYKYWALVLAVSIAFSRMYLHVHYPSDILGGIILGLISARASLYLTDIFTEKKKNIQ